MTTYSPQEQQYLSNTPVGGTRQPVSKNTGLMISAIVVVVIGVTIWSLVSAVYESHSKGTLEIQVSDTSTEITVLQAYKPPIKAGKGNQKLHVDPGLYTVVAALGDKQSAKTVTTDKQSTTTISLDLKDTTKKETLANYGASDLFTTNSTAYFVNGSSQVPNKLSIGESASQPIATDTYPASRIEKAGDSAFFALKNNTTWFYIHDNQEVALTYPAMLPRSMTFTKSGAFAYLDSSSNVWYASSPTATPTKVGVAPKNHNLAIAPTGDILTYPTFNDNSKATLIKAGQSKTLGLNTGVSYATWSPDGTKIAYAYNKGIYVFDTGTGKTVCVISAAIEDDHTLDWSDNNTLIFPYGGSIWKFDTTSNSAHKLTNYKGGISAASLWIDTSFAYFSTIGDTDGNGSSGVLYRVALSANASNSATPVAPDSLKTTYTGFADLLNYGVSSDQLANTDYAISKYVDSLKPTPAQVVVNDISSVPKASRYATQSSLLLNLSIGNTNLQAKLDFEGLSSSQLRLFNSSGAQVYDSGVLGTGQ